MQMCLGNLNITLQFHPLCHPNFISLSEIVNTPLTLDTNTGKCSTPYEKEVYSSVPLVYFF